MGWDGIEWNNTKWDGTGGGETRLYGCGVVEVGKGWWPEGHDCTRSSDGGETRFTSRTAAITTALSLLHFLLILIFDSRMSLPYVDRFDLLFCATPEKYLDACCSCYSRFSNIFHVVPPTYAKAIAPTLREPTTPLQPAWLFRGRRPISGFQLRRFLLALVAPGKHGSDRRTIHLASNAAVVNAGYSSQPSQVVGYVDKA